MYESMQREPSERIQSIDLFRGFTIIAMIAVNYLSGIQCIPAFLKHAPDVGLTVTDLVAPTFIFAIGLTYKLSFEKRLKRDGLSSTYLHFATRFLAFMGIGAFFTGGAALVSPVDAAGAWGVLQAIGAAGLIALIFIRTRAWVRLAVGTVLLCAYQFMLQNFWLAQVLGSVQGGLEGSISWGALLLFSTSMADLFFATRSRKWVFALAALAVLVLGIISSNFFILSKHRVSLSYVLISVGAASTVFYLFDFLSGRRFVRLQVLEWWGINPLLLYLMHMLLLGVTFLPGNEIWYKGAPLWSGLIQLAGFFTAMCLAAWWLYKKKVRLSL
jgi:predicted acyltransferase